MSQGTDRPEPKALRFVGTSREDLRSFPHEVRQALGHALYLAQTGDKHPRAKPLSGYRGAGVLEVVDDFAGDTFRAVYTVRFRDAVYVLHAFQKKSKAGIRTPKRELDLIDERLRQAERHYQQTLEQSGR
jgi:phage-related protein